MLRTIPSPFRAPRQENQRRHRIHRSVSASFTLRAPSLFYPPPGLDGGDLLARESRPRLSIDGISCRTSMACRADLWGLAGVALALKYHRNSGQSHQSGLAAPRAGKRKDPCRVGFVWSANVTCVGAQLPPRHFLLLSSTLVCRKVMAESRKRATRY